MWLGAVVGAVGIVALLVGVAGFILHKRKQPEVDQQQVVDTELPNLEYQRETSTDRFFTSTDGYLK
eukprot:NODE_910_length_559_cov_27.638889_g900_i0.p1 GENE.NODE_910_length_559_cov_27.638889_g900_i0~~NODE_910_length_559_cov_27.638889_g900_i0.p1  ORF type:complete len:73 (+),score=34.25 NODE_910_length_559_cov_27.638889_g900_i0:24-221(+)